MAHLSIGVFTGFAMSGAMFPIILSAISRAVTPEKRDFYLGIASAGGSSGQVIMIPLGQFFIDSQGWVFSLYMMSIMTLLIVPLAFVMVRKSADEPAAAVAHQGSGAAIREAFTHRGYVLLTSGYFVCGLQTMFIGTHFQHAAQPANRCIDCRDVVVVDRGIQHYRYFCLGRCGRQIPAEISAVLAVQPAVGNHGGVYPDPAIHGDCHLVLSLHGILWLGTVPLTGSIVAKVFGLRHMGMLFGFAFVAHQLGSFIGIYAAGYFFDLFETTMLSGGPPS